MCDVHAFSRFSEVAPEMREGFIIMATRWALRNLGLQKIAFPSHLVQLFSHLLCLIKCSLASCIVGVLYYQSIHSVRTYVCGIHRRHGERATQWPRSSSMIWSLGWQAS